MVTWAAVVATQLFLAQHALLPVTPFLRWDYIVEYTLHPMHYAPRYYQLGRTRV